MDDIALEKTNLPSRVKHVLIRNGVITIGDLYRVYKNNSLNSIFMLGEKGFSTVEEFLQSYSFLTKDAPNQEISFIKNRPDPFSGLPTYNIFEHSGDLVYLRLSLRTYKALSKNGIKTIDNLTGIYKSGGLNKLRQIGPSSVEEIKNKLNQWNDKLSISAELNDRKDVCCWAEIIHPFLISLDDKKILIFFTRFGTKTLTLEELSSKTHVTRERVRQIQTKLAMQLIKHVSNINSSGVLTKINKIMAESGTDLSIDGLRTKLEISQILGKFMQPLFSPWLKEIDVFESLICWLTIASEDRYFLSSYYKNIVRPIKIDIGFFKNTQGISIKNKRVVDAIPTIVHRKISRRVIYTGGIFLQEAKNLVNGQEEIARLILNQMNMIEVIPNWFTFSTLEGINKSIPLQTAGMKMLSVTDRINLNDFYDGLSRRAGRFFDIMAPIEVVKPLLGIMGFMINKDFTVSCNSIQKGALSRSEICFIEAVKENNGVVSLLEVAETFFANHLSLPAVSVTLQRSPIVEKLDSGLYKIRGIQISLTQLEQAQKRQKKYSQDEEVAYGLDGVIRTKITITSYTFLTGVINAGRIKDLAGEWQLFCDGQVYEKVKIEGLFLWSLISVLEKLDAQIGDRIELDFNTWTRALVVKRV